MKRILTGAAAMRREDRLQQREDRLSDRVLDLRAQIASLTAENKRLRFHLKNMVELADEFTPEEPDDYASDLRDIAAARAELEPKEGEG